MKKFLKNYWGTILAIVYWICFCVWVINNDPAHDDIYRYGYEAGQKSVMNDETIRFYIEP